MIDILLVSFGAIFGSNIRFLIYERLRILYMTNQLCILTINTIASFLLGVLISILPRIESSGSSNQFALFFFIGLLGSLSTFSTFVYDLYEFIIKFKFDKAFKLFFISISSATIALAFGFFLGNN